MAKLYGADRIGDAPSTINQSGGARRDRTDDLMLAKHALSQLSYGPFLLSLKRRRRHPSPWLSRHQARRPFGLATPSASIEANQANRLAAGAKRRKPDRAPRLTPRKPAGL